MSHHPADFSDCSLKRAGPKERRPEGDEYGTEQGLGQILAPYSGACVFREGWNSARAARRYLVCWNQGLE